MKTDLAAWQAQPNFARELAEFLGGKTGSILLAVLKHEFRAVPLNDPVVAGVDYLQVHALRNSAREACQRVFDTIESMAIPRPPKPAPRESSPGFHAPLVREPEKESPQKPTPKPKSRRKL